MNDKEYNFHLRTLYDLLLGENGNVAYTAKEILFNTYGLIIFNNEAMSVKKRNKLAHGK
jgi:hypothetical protein